MREVLDDLKVRVLADRERFDREGIVVDDEEWARLIAYFESRTTCHGWGYVKKAAKVLDSANILDEEGRQRYWPTVDSEGRHDHSPMAGGKMILFVGEHPKGFDRPFHPSTVSGKRLRDMVNEAGLDVSYLNLWRSQEEQDEGGIGSGPLSRIIECIATGGKCVALGRRVQHSLKGFDVQHLPHPGARTHFDIDALRNGIESLRGCTSKSSSNDSKGDLAARDSATV